MKYTIIERTDYGWKEREITPEQEAARNYAAIGVVVVGLVFVMILL